MLCVDSSVVGRRGLENPPFFRSAHLHRCNCDIHAVILCVVAASEVPPCRPSAEVAEEQASCSKRGPTSNSALCGCRRRGCSLCAELRELCLCLLYSQYMRHQTDQAAASDKPFSIETVVVITGNRAKQMPHVVEVHEVNKQPLELLAFDEAISRNCNWNVSATTITRRPRERERESNYGCVWM